MENKKYLTEENYEKGKSKLKGIILVILTIGLLVGGGLILTGIIKTNILKTEMSQDKSKRTESDVQAEILEIEAKLEDIEKEIDSLNTQMNRLSNEKSKIFMEDKGFSDRYYAKDEEINAKNNEIIAKRRESTKLNISKSNLETELWKINSGFNDTEDSIELSKYIPLYIIGAFIIFMSLMISLLFISY